MVLVLGNCFRELEDSRSNELRDEKRNKLERTHERIQKGTKIFLVVCKLEMGAFMTELDYYAKQVCEDLALTSPTLRRWSSALESKGHIIRV